MTNISNFRATLGVVGSILFHAVLAGVVFSSLRSPPAQVKIESFEVAVEQPAAQPTAAQTTAENAAEKAPQAAANSAHAASLSAPLAPMTPSSETVSAPPATNAPAVSSSVMNAYFEHVRDRLSAVLKIPNVHVTSSLKVMLKLTLEESGEVRNPAISQGSGSDELDRAVLEAVDRAKPFSRFSPEMAGLHEVTLTLPVEVRPGR